MLTLWEVPFSGKDSHDGHCSFVFVKLGLAALASSVRVIQGCCCFLKIRNLPLSDEILGYL